MKLLTKISRLTRILKENWNGPAQSLIVIEFFQKDPNSNCTFSVIKVSNLLNVIKRAVNGLFQPLSDYRDIKKPMGVRNYSNAI